MDGGLQISARVWTGQGAVRRLVIETEGERIARILPESTPLRGDARVYPDNSLLIPGLHDAHTHPLFGGLQLTNADFSGVASREEFSDRLRDYLAKREDDPRAWVQGTGLDETRVRISRVDIDKVCADVPVFIWSHDLHTAFVNSAALIRARIEGRVKDPDGGKFERDASGILNGVLRETAAHQVRRLISPPTPDQARKALLRAQALAFSLGITAVGGSARKDEIPHYLNFADSSDQKLRINLWRVSDNFRFEDDRFEKVSGMRFRYATLKGFVDGALGSQTAAMWESYENDSSNSGVATIKEGPLARWVRAAHGEGYQIALHAIGDRANSICLDAIEMAGASGRGPEYRPRIEHAQILRSRDIKRFTEIGVIASMQPIHCTADLRFVEPRIGAERAKGAYAWRSLLSNQVVLAFGSDWPVETLDPIAGIHAAVTRQDDHDQPPGGWQPQERLTVAEALRAYTGAAAYAAFWEESLGTIEEGKLADFTVLSQDLFAIPPEDILKTRVLATIVGGEVVFRAPATSES
jgi:hypothetical protein